MRSPFQTRYSYSSLTLEQRARLRSLIPADDPTEPLSGLANTQSRPPGCDLKLSCDEPRWQSKRRRMQHSLLTYFRQRDFQGISVTLTFRTLPPPHYLTEDIAQAAVTELLKRLDKFVRGRGHPVKLKTIAVREGSTRSQDPTRLHYHLKIEVPSRMSKENFAKKVAHYWTKLEWASRDQNRFDVRCDDGWLTYILKGRSKVNYADAFDCINTRVPPHPTAECSAGG